MHVAYTTGLPEIRRQHNCLRIHIFFEFLRRIGGTMVRRGCLKCGRSWAEALVRSDQIKDYTIGICCYGSNISLLANNVSDI
jgi:hypothetical protein